MHERLNDFFELSHASLAAFLFTFCKQPGEKFFKNAQLVSFENILKQEYNSHDIKGKYKRRFDNYKI
jgi:hypothetical protein